MEATDDTIAAAHEVVPVEALGDDRSVFSPAELAYARSKRDPERRLAARLAAKRALARLLGCSVADSEVVRGRYGPPELRLSETARARLERLGARRVLVSLTHERRDAAASVLLLREPA